MTSKDQLEVQYLQQRAHALSRALFLRLDEYVEDFPTGTPPDLIKLFKRVAKEAEATIEETTDTDRLSLISRTLNNVATYAMTLLDHAHTAQTPRGLTQFLERLHKALQPEAKLLVTPLAGYNYTIENQYPPLEKTLSGTLVPEDVWNEISKPYCHGLNVVRFPRLERGNLLLHAIFGHEFGHPIADDFLTIDQKSPEYESELESLNGCIEQDCAAYLAAESDATERTKFRSELYRMAIEARRCGLEELISDAVAVLLFGASALFAAAEFLIPDGLDHLPQEDDYYPPSRYRLRIMCQVLSETGHMDALRSLPIHADLKPVKDELVRYLDYLVGLAQDTRDLKSIEDDGLTKSAYAWLSRTLPAGLKFATAAVGESAYAATALTNEVPEALHRIHLGVPPSEIGTYPEVRAVDWRTPVLAGWMHKLYRSTQTDIDWEARHKHVSHIQSLSLKGVEDALLRAEYHSRYPVALGRGQS